MRKYDCETFYNRKLNLALIDAAAWTDEIEKQHEDDIGVYFSIDDIVSDYDKEFDSWEINIYYSYDE